MSAIDEYAADLSSRLRVSRTRRTTMLDEVRDHLLEYAERACALGAPRDQAEADAITAFGSPASMARQFNAAAGAKAMRRSPLVAVAAGMSVVVSFLVAAISQPKATQQATPPMQVFFFLGVIAFQVAVISGACGASRAVARWGTSATSGRDREFVRRCSIISMAALSAGVLAVTINMFLDARQASHANGIALAAGATVMIVAATAGLVTAMHLDVNAADDDVEAGGSGSPALLMIGEALISLVHRFPVLSCAAATLAATTWAMSQAETATIVGSLPWGISEAAAVIAGFVLLGPALGLRSAATEQTADLN